MNTHNIYRQHAWTHKKQELCGSLCAVSEKRMNAPKRKNSNEIKKDEQDQVHHDSSKNRFSSNILSSCKSLPVNQLRTEKKNIHIKFVKWMCNFCRRFVCFTVRSLARSISFMSRVQNVAEFSWIMLISTKCCTVSYMKFWIWKQHYTHKWIYTTTYYNLWCLISLQNPTFFFSSVLFEFSLGLFTRSNEKLLDYCSGFIRYFLKLTE